MPAYDYRCLDCQHEYEKREGFDAPALQKCPVCGGTARRVIHAPPIVFKGSGFYVTDSRKAAAEAQSEASGESPSPKDSDSKADASTKSDGASSNDKSSKSDGASLGDKSSKSDSASSSDKSTTTDKTPAAS